VTAALPLTLTKITSAPPQNTAITPAGAGVGISGDAQDFSGILQSLPDKDAHPDRLVAALRQLFPALSAEGGNGLPASLTVDQLLGVLRQAGLKLDKITLTQLETHGQDPAATVMSPELMALLQLLVTPRPADPQAGGTGPLATAGNDPRGVGQGGDAVLNQLLTGLPNGGQDGTKPLQVPTQTAQPTVTAANVSQDAADLKQLLLQMISDPGHTQTTPVAVAGDNTAKDGILGSTDIISKLFGGAIAPERLVAVERDLLNAQLTGTQKVSPAGGSSGGQAGANTPTPFLSALINQPGTVPSPSATAQPMAVSVPMNQPGWDQALGQNVLWMAKHDVQVASMRLNPPQLGPLEVRITFNQDQANVSFFSHHGVVREAVEAALPRLREMFGEGGINLVNVDVSGDSSQGRLAAGSDGGSGGGGPDPGFSHAESTLTPQEAPVTALHMPSTGLVDYFA
jgi:hypothetical protein